LPADAAPSFVWVPELCKPGGRLELPESEIRYLARVCRARAGDRVTVTDGRGWLASARLTPGRPLEAEIETLEHRPEDRRAVVLCGAPEGQRADWLVEKLAELGVSEFQPIDCEREAWERSAGRINRWQRLAVAALKQSRRCHLLQILDPLPLAEAISRLSEVATRWLADPGGTWAGGQRPDGRECIGLVGPASGLTSLERSQLSDLEFRRIRLSDARLRTETAALAWASWWSFGVLAAPAARPTSA
jgi:16S rRNA (uracil1498-N3)-methyltransferase